VIKEALDRGDRGLTYTGEFLGGFVGVAQVEQTLALQP
jgi:hypothetical protein